MRLLGWTGLALLMTGVAAVVAGTLWYRHDRTAALAAACRMGLPNFSHPAQIRADGLGCTILGPRRRVRGVLVTGFEESSLHSPDLERAPERGGRGGVWYEASETRKLDPALARKLKGLDSGAEDAVATLTVEGWATVMPGEYGHLGQYSRIFYADRVVAVDPAPRDFLLRHLVVEACNHPDSGCGRP